MAIKGLKQQLQSRAREVYDERDKGGVTGERYLSIGGDVSIYKPKDGKNAIDIIPFYRGTDLFKGKPAGTPDYQIEIFIHKSFNQSGDRVICPKKTRGKPCPACEKRYLLMDLNREETEAKDAKERQTEIDNLRPQRRVLLNVINLKEDEDDEHNGDIQILDESQYLFAKELIEESMEGDENGDPIDFTTPDEGKSVFFSGRPKPIGNSKHTYLEFKSFSFTERDEPYDDEIINESHKLDSLLKIHTYEEIAAMLSETKIIASEDTTDEEEEKSTKKSKASRFKKGKAKVQEEEDDEEEEYEEPDDEEEEEDTPPPASKKRARKPKAPEVEEDEDEEEEAPTKPKGKAELCPHGLTYGVDGDPTEETCQKCAKENKTLSRKCILASIS